MEPLDHAHDWAVTDPPDSHGEVVLCIRMSGGGLGESESQPRRLFSALEMSHRAALGCSMFRESGWRAGPLVFHVPSLRAVLPGPAGVLPMQLPCYSQWAVLRTLRKWPT